MRILRTAGGTKGWRKRRRDFWSLQMLRSFQLANRFYRRCEMIICPAELKEQLLGEVSGVASGLAGETTRGAQVAGPQGKQACFDALTRLMRCQEILKKIPSASDSLREMSDILGTHIAISAIL